jgi:toxin ParE1/3/4
VAHEIVFSPEARADLEQLYLYIAERAGEDIALSYVERIESYCLSFADFPGRGLSRDDLTPGLRVIGFERRVSIAFHVDRGRVTFVRILYGGRDLDALLSKD